MTHGDQSSARPSRSRTSDQLDLFGSNDDEHKQSVGIGETFARASISPAWWPLVRAIFAYGDGLVVQDCREVDGELVLRATPVDDRAAMLVSDLVSRIRKAVASTCGCCGGSPAAAYRGQFADPTRVVCSSCRARLQAGESFLAIADEHWRLDGTPRPRSAVTEFARRSPALDDAAIVDVAVRSGPLPGDEMIRIYKEIRLRVASRVIRLEEQVSKISLVGTLHVAGGLPRGPRVLLIGPSGSGKNTLIDGLRFALEPFGLPWICTPALGLVAVGWQGNSIYSLIQNAPGNDPPNPRAIIVIDELHHARHVADTGASAAHRTEVLGSLLEIVGGGVIQLGDDSCSTEFSCAQALVIGMGAFEGLIDLTTPKPRPIPTREFVRAGIPLELASRWTEEVIVLPTPNEDAVREILRHWPALVSLKDVCLRMGCPPRIPEETIARAARVVSRGHDRATLRTAGGWIVAALRSTLAAALDAGEPRELIIAPDALDIPPNAFRPPRDDPPPGGGGWDATILLTPR